MWNSLKNQKLSMGFQHHRHSVWYHGREEVGVPQKEDLDNRASLKMSLGGAEEWDGENVGENLPWSWVRVWVWRRANFLNKLLLSTNISSLYIKRVTRLMNSNFGLVSCPFSLFFSFSFSFKFASLVWVCFCFFF